MKQTVDHYWEELRQLSRQVEKMPAGDTAAQIRNIMDEIKRQLILIDKIMNSDMTFSGAVIDRKLDKIDQKKLEINNLINHHEE